MSLRPEHSVVIKRESNNYILCNNYSNEGIATIIGDHPYCCSKNYIQRYKPCMHYKTVIGTHDRLHISNIIYDKALSSNSPVQRVGPNKSSNSLVARLDRTSSPTRPFGELDQLIYLRPILIAPSFEIGSNLLFSNVRVKIETAGLSPLCTQT
ncbi:hypothetical protein YC2023_071237 [Brassica napus]